MISARIVCPQFIGRAEELEHLLQRRRNAGEKRGGLALIAGEPGIGKSRLLREFKDRLNRHTSLIASSACREFARKPLGPLLDILAQIAPERAGNLAWSSKHERLDDIAATFERVSAKRTTVAMLEDLHWADIDLMQTLLVVARRAAENHLLLVATYRSNEVLPAHPLFRWFGQLVREPAVTTIALQRFSDRELDRLMSLSIRGTAALAPQVLHAVRERADGNPLFAEELLRNAVDSQRADGFPSHVALPLSLHAIVVERLDGCTHAERLFLQRASVFGRDFRIVQVCEIFGGAASAMQPILERLCDLQLIDRRDADKDAYRFRHALTRDVVYGEMPREVVKPLHLTIARHLERSSDARSVPEVLGHHFWEAGLLARAALHYERAGDAAMEVYAYDDAAAFYQRAAAGFEHDAGARARIYARAARAQIFAGDLDNGLALYERSVELALLIGDVGEVVRSRVLMAGHLFDGGRRDAAIALLRSTLPIAKSAEPMLLARLRTRLAMTLARDARIEDAWSELQAIDDVLFDSRAEFAGEYHLCASELHALRGEPQPWLSSFAKGIGIYEALRHPGPLQIAHANFADQALCLGETELARAHHRIAAELARTLNFDDQVILRAQVEFYAGDLAEAKRIVDSTHGPSRFLMRAEFAQVALPVAIALGDDRMLERCFDERLLAELRAQPYTATHVRVAAALALALAAMNRRAEARQLLERVLPSLNTAFGMTLPIVAVTALLPERAAELKPLLELAASREGDRVGKALLAMVCGEPLEAARRFGEIGWPLLEARCLELGDQRRAAVAIYKRCAAAGELRRIEFGSAGGEEDATPLRILTVRERELALQVAAGKPNRAVADALSIGEKTVEKYLTSIYAKLGLTSRAQLAAFVATAQARGDEHHGVNSTTPLPL